MHAHVLALYPQLPSQLFLQVLKKAARGSRPGYEAAKVPGCSEPVAWLLHEALTLLVLLDEGEDVPGTSMERIEAWIHGRENGTVNGIHVVYQARPSLHPQPERLE